MEIQQTNAGSGDRVAHTDVAELNRREISENSDAARMSDQQLDEVVPGVSKSKLTPAINRNNKTPVITPVQKGLLSKMVTMTGILGGMLAAEGQAQQSGTN